MPDQAIGTEVAADTNSKAVMKAPANRVAVWRAVANELSILISLFEFVRDPTIGPRLLQCRDRANSKIALFFSEALAENAETAGGRYRKLGKIPTQVRAIG
jgi:hypothetical protein